MSMWLYDDLWEMEEFQLYQKEVRRLEREYLEIRILLRDAEQDYGKDPDSEYLKAKVNYLQKRLKQTKATSALQKKQQAITAKQVAGKKN